MHAILRMGFCWTIGFVSDDAYLDIKQIIDCMLQDLPWRHDSQINRTVSNFVEGDDDDWSTLFKIVSN
jgi:hypothetical protein